MGREWYPSDEGTWHCQVGVDWQYSSDANNVYVKPIVYRWDNNNTNNSGSKFWETLSPDTNGSGSWSGLGWGSGSGTRTVDTFNQRTYSRGHSAYNVTLTIGWDSSFGTWYGGSFRTLGSGQHSWTISVPAKSSYAVSYNANGGSGAPSNQTKWYGENLTLSSTKPTKSGYEFVGWATSASATSANYSPGSTYTGNSALTLYAVWIQNIFTCTIHYDANGGTGAPVNQTHVQKSTSTISGMKPTRYGYTFLGWSASKSATKATYIPNGRYANDSFSDGDTITLYAVWAVASLNTYVKVPDSGGTQEVVKTLIENVTIADQAELCDFTVPSAGAVLALEVDLDPTGEGACSDFDFKVYHWNDTDNDWSSTPSYIYAYPNDEDRTTAQFNITTKGKYRIKASVSMEPMGITKVTLTTTEPAPRSIKNIYVKVPDEAERKVVDTYIDATLNMSNGTSRTSTFTVPASGGVLSVYGEDIFNYDDTITVTNNAGEQLVSWSFEGGVAKTFSLNLSQGEYTISANAAGRTDGFTVKVTLTFNETYAPSLKAIYYNVVDLNLTTSDNLPLVDSSGNYLMAKGV